MHGIRGFGREVLREHPHDSFPWSDFGVDVCSNVLLLLPTYALNLLRNLAFGIRLNGQRGNYERESPTDSFTVCSCLDEGNSRIAMA